MNWTLKVHVNALASATESQSGRDVSEVKQAKVVQIATYGMISTRKDRTPVCVYLDNVTIPAKWLSQASCSCMRGAVARRQKCIINNPQLKGQQKVTITWEFCTFYINLDASTRVVLRKKGYSPTQSRPNTVPNPLTCHLAKEKVICPSAVWDQ